MPKVSTLTVRQQQPWDESPWTPPKSPTGLYYLVPKAHPDPFVRMGWQPKTRVPHQRHCREIIKPNRNNPIPTPSVWVHTPRCRCALEKLDREHQDEALTNTITTLSTTYRARLKLEAEISISLPKAKKSQHKRSRSSVLLTRLFSSLAPSNLGGKQPHPNIISIQHLADLCNGCSELDAPKVITYLHDHRIPINTANHLGFTPLICALRSPLAKTRPKSHLAFLKFLLESGANPNLPSTGPSDPSTPLSVACSLNSLPSEHIEAILKLLLDRGAAVDLAISSLGSSSSGGKANRQTALHIATLCSNPTALSFLLGYGNANPNTSVNHNGPSVSPLHLAAHTDTVCASVLLKHGADPLARDQQGRTPLHWAAEYGYDVDLVELLMGYMKDDRQKVEVVGDVLRRVVKHLEHGHGRKGHVGVVRALLLQGTTTTTAAGGKGEGSRRISRNIRERLEKLDEEWGRGPVFEAMIVECLSTTTTTTSSGRNSLSSRLSGETAVDEKGGQQVAVAVHV